MIAISTLQKGLSSKYPLLKKDKRSLDTTVSFEKEPKILLNIHLLQYLASHTK